MLSGPHSKFCERIVAGDNKTKAYRAAYPKATVKSAAEAGAVLSKNLKIQKEIARLRAVEAAVVKKELTKMVRKKVMDRQRASEILTEIAQAKKGTGYANARIKAAQVLGTWEGWETGTKAEQQIADSLTDELELIRAKR